MELVYATPNDVCTLSWRGLIATGQNCARICAKNYQTRACALQFFISFMQMWPKYFLKFCFKDCFQSEICAYTYVCL